MLWIRDALSFSKERKEQIEDVEPQKKEHKESHKYDQNDDGES